MHAPDDVACAQAAAWPLSGVVLVHELAAVRTGDTSTSRSGARVTLQEAGSAFCLPSDAVRRANAGSLLPRRVGDGKTGSGFGPALGLGQRPRADNSAVTYADMARRDRSEFARARRDCDCTATAAPGVCRTLAVYGANTAAENVYRLSIF
jgi:hypothetical protein